LLAHSETRGEKKEVSETPTHLVIRKLNKKVSIKNPWVLNPRVS